MNLTPDQTQAVTNVLSVLASGRDVVLVGYAGTGKTTCTAEIVRHLRSRGRGVVVSAPTHKAARVLSGKIGDACTTHSFLGLRPQIDSRTGEQYFSPDRSASRNNFHNCDVLVVDEASMIGRGASPERPGLLEYVREASSLYSFPTLWVGDGAQLPPVGEDESPALEAPPEQTVELTKVLRHAGPILSYAHAVRSSQRRPDRADSHGLRSYDDLEKWLTSALELFRSPEFEGDSDHCRILCWTNEAVRQCCRRVHAGIYGPGADPWQPGQRVVASKPYQRAGAVVLQNSDEVTILRAPRIEDVDGVQCWVLQISGAGEIPVVSRGGAEEYRSRLESLRSDALSQDVPWRRAEAWRRFYEWDGQFAKVDPIYAQTVHKSQGSTYRHAFVHRADVFRNRDLSEALRCYYTAVTRAAEGLYVLE